MPDKILNIVFKATDKASGVIDDIKGEDGTKGVGGIASALAGLTEPALIAGAAIATVGGAVLLMMKDWQDHVIGIGGFAAVLGISTEEASALNAIAQDYNITQGDMLTAMENLVRDGLDPTVEGLIEAKGLIEGSEDPTDRLTTAFDLLGKKGAEELIPIFNDLTDDELRNYIETMGESEVVTLGMLAAAGEQRDALDFLAGTWDSLKLSIGGVLALNFGPFLSNLAAALRGANIVTTEYGQAGRWMDTAPSGDIAGSQAGNWMPSTSGSGGSALRRGGVGRGARGGAYATGGGFTVGGFGGPDSQLVQFMGTPGEDVSIGGGTSDMAAILAEMRRLVNMLPIAISDAVERVM